MPSSCSANVLQKRKRKERIEQVRNTQIFKTETGLDDGVKYAEIAGIMDVTVSVDS